MVKKKVVKAMKAAKKLEKIPVPKDKELLKVYKDTKQSIQRLNKLLKPQWYLDDTTKRSSKRKKKSL